MNGATDSVIPTAPGTKPVKNGTAWLAAFGPSLSGFAAVGLGLAVWGSPESWSGGTKFVLFVLRVAIVHQLMRWDYRSLRRQGFDPKAMGVSSPNNLPVYLFSRAKAFGHSRKYAYTWCVVVLLNILVEVV